MNAPPPSKRTFLSDLPSHPPDSKVRFLGCVRTYNIPTGHLLLEHNYPRTNIKSSAPSVWADINAVLGSVGNEELRVGAWVNVVGYVRDAKDLDLIRESNLVNGTGTGTGPGRSVYVEAVMLFPAGPVALGEYERILTEALNVDRRLGRG